MLCGAANAMATEWTSIIKNDDYEVLVDIDSYNTEANAPYMTSKTIFKQPQTYLLNQKEVQYSTSITNRLFNCREAQYKIQSIALYNQKDQLLVAEKGIHTFKEIAAGSREFSIGQLTCQVHSMLGGQ